MKKISLEALEELAKKMPVINETDQEKYAGGTYYIDYNGGDFGQVGLSDRLALLGTKQMYDYAVANRLEDYGLDLFKATDEAFDSGSIHQGQHVQKNVFAKYAEQVINYTGPVLVVNDWYADDLYYTRSGQPGVSGALCFNNSKSGMIFSNEGLTQRLLQVQKDIHPDPVYPGGFDPEDPGRDPKTDTIMVAIKKMDIQEKEERDQADRTKDWRRYTDIFWANQRIRKQYASELYSLWNEQGYTGYGYGITDANKICGVKDNIDILPYYI